MLAARGGPVHGLYASFAAPIAGGLTSSTRLMVITTNSAAALAAGSTLAGVDAADRSGAMLWLTLMAGGFMIGAALVNLGRYIRFVSYSVCRLPDRHRGQHGLRPAPRPQLGAETDGGVAIQKAWYVVTHPSGIDVPTSLRIAALALMVLLAHTRIDTFSSLVPCWCRPSRCGSRAWPASPWSRTTARCRTASRCRGCPTPARSACP